MIREKYGLQFYKFIDPVDNEVNYVCKRDIVNSNSELQIITQFTKSESEALIREIENAQNGLYYEEIFISQCVDADSLTISPPNININDILILPMQDMKGLLQEWIIFIQS